MNVAFNLPHTLHAGSRSPLPGQRSDTDGSTLVKYENKMWVIRIFPVLIWLVFWKNPDYPYCIFIFNQGTPICPCSCPWKGRVTTFA